MSAVAKLKTAPIPAPALDFRAHAEDGAALMLRSGRALAATVGLIARNDMHRECEDGEDFLSPGDISGLMDAIHLIADQLTQHGEDLTELMLLGSPAAKE